MWQRRFRQSGSRLPGLRMFNDIFFEQATRWSTCSTGVTCIHSNRSRVDANLRFTTFELASQQTWEISADGGNTMLQQICNYFQWNKDWMWTYTTSQSRCPTWIRKPHNKRRDWYKQSSNLQRCCNKCIAPTPWAASTQATSRGSEATSNWQRGSSNSGQKRWSTTISKRSMCGASTIYHSPCPRTRSNSSCATMAQHLPMINRWKTEKSSNAGMELRQHPGAEAPNQQSLVQQEVQHMRARVHKIRWVFDQHLQLGNRCKTKSHQPCTEVNA